MCDVGLLSLEILPIDAALNLFICGPSTHPGGGLHGSNAVNMVTQIIK